MKFAAIVAAAAYATVANAASCDVTSLETLLTSTDTTTCATDSGYTVTSLATPTDAEMAVMCTSTACQSVLSQLESLAPSECTLGTFALYADLITPLTEYCSGSTAGSSATTTTVGSTTGSTATAATVGSTTTSSTGSAATTTTTSTTSSGSSTTETTSSASAAASASASASTSGASMAAVSAGAVLAAVAATFF